MKTQNDMLLAYMKKGKSITSLGAYDMFGITRLSARVFDLRSSGINIKDKFIHVKNRWNEEVRVKQYYL